MVKSATSLKVSKSILSILKHYRKMILVMYVVHVFIKSLNKLINPSIKFYYLVLKTFKKAPSRVDNFKYRAPHGYIYICLQNQSSPVGVHALNQKNHIFCLFCNFLLHIIAHILWFF